MIQQNELRVGNYVQKDGKFYLADFITIQMAHNYDPVLLKQDMMEGFGFKFDGFVSYRSDDFPEEINYCKSDGTFALVVGSYELIVGRWFKYVHELQNLFYFMTGDELQIKL